MIRNGRDVLDSSPAAREKSITRRFRDDDIYLRNIFLGKPSIKKLIGGPYEFSVTPVPIGLGFGMALGLKGLDLGLGLVNIPVFWLRQENMVLNGRLYVDHLEAAAQPGAGDHVVPGLGDASQSAHDPPDGLPRVLLHGAQPQLARALVKLGGRGMPGGHVDSGDGGVGVHILRVAAPVTAVKQTDEPQ